MPQPPLGSAIKSFQNGFADLRMRILSSSTTVQNADKVARMIVNTYLAPNKTFPELRDMVNSSAIDPLRDFSEASRQELQRFGFV